MLLLLWTRLDEIMRYRCTGGILVYHLYIDLLQTSIVSTWTLIHAPDFFVSSRTIAPVLKMTLELVNLLIQYGASKHIPNHRGTTAVELAKKLNSLPEIQKILRDSDI